MSNKGGESGGFFSWQEVQAALYGQVRVNTGSTIQVELHQDQVLPYDLRLIGEHFPAEIRYKVVCGQRLINNGMRFGPYTGTIIYPEESGSVGDLECMWEVFKDDKLSHYIDGTTSPNNWIKYIRCARHHQEQNLGMVQCGDEVYYYALRDISPGEELLVWYSNWSYTLYMGIPLGLKMRGRHKGSDDVNTGGPSYPCHGCGKLFSYKNYRDKHLKYTRCMDTGDRKFPCSLCDRSFDKRDRLRIHIRHVHDKHRPHQCKVCNKRFSQSSSLNKHMRVHSGERPYKCPYCVKAFTASSILRTHIRQHSGEKPFKCRYCGRTFASHAAHDSHVRRVHEEKEGQFKCQTCGRAFDAQQHLAFHFCPTL